MCFSIADRPDDTVTWDAGGGLMEVAGRQRVVAVAVAVLLALLTAVMVTAAAPDPPRTRSGYAAVAGAALAAWRERQAQDELLRDRLGGLSALVTTGEPDLAGCEGPDTPVPAPTVDDQVATVWAQVEVLRELTMDEPVEVRLLDDVAMTEQVAWFFARRWSAERLDHDRRVLGALGAVGPDADLEKLRVDLLADQVSGFFSASEGAIGVRTGQPDALTPLERAVLAHEVEHALTHRNLGRRASGSADAARAATAVVEGSAALAMRWYAGAVLTGQERAGMRAELLERALADPLAGFSPYLRDELRFPYRAGLRFVCERWREGGWEAVDAAHADPPRTTAGVLFPHRRDEAPQAPEPVGDPGPGWTRVRGTDFGAAELLWLLAAPGGDPTAALADPLERAGAWAGGELVAWVGGEQTAVGLALVDRAAGPRLCDSIGAWYRAAFPEAAASSDGTRTAFGGDRQQAVLACDRDQVRLGIAPTMAGARAIAR